jgi:hypothetical protein
MLLFKVTELHNLLPSPNITGLIKSRGMQWATILFEGNENCEQKFRRKPEERKSKSAVHI